MAAFNFPNSPSTNDIHNENGVSWKWNGSVWKKIGTVANTFDQINVTGVSTSVQLNATTVNVTGISTFKAVYVGDDNGSNNNRIRLGASQDLSLWHDATNSYVSNTTGDLFVQTGSAKAVYIRPNNGANGVICHPSGSVSLYHNNVLKFETVSYGVVSKGSVEIQSGSMTTADSSDSGTTNSAIFGTGSDLKVFHDGSNSYIKDTGSGGLRLCSSEFNVKNAANNQVIIRGTESSSVELYHANSKKLETTSTGISVTGSVIASSNVQIGDSDEFIAGDGNDLRLWHNATDSYIKNYTGDLWIQGDGDDIHMRAADDINIYTQTSDKAIVCVGDGAVELYYDNSKKLATNSDGIDLGDNVKLRIGDAPDYKIYHNGSSTYHENYTGDLFIKSDQMYLASWTSGEHYLHAVKDGRVALYYNNSTKFETTNTGVKITSSTNGDGINILSGNNSNTIYLDANRTGANNGIGQVCGRWNGTTVAQMSFNCGDDTTNKDDGYIWFGTESAASNGNVNATERLRIQGDGDIVIGTVGDAGNKVYFQSTSGSAHWVQSTGTDNQDLQFGRSTTEYLRIDNGGRIRIGRTNKAVAKGKLIIDNEDRNAMSDRSDPDNFGIVLCGSSTSNEGNGIAFCNDNAQNTAAAIIAVDRGSNNLGDLRFYTKDEGSPSGGPKEGFRINQKGSLVGATGGFRNRDDIKVYNTMAMPQWHEGYATSNDTLSVAASMFHQTHVRGTSHLTTELFSTKMGGNGGMFVLVEVWFSCAVSNLQGYQMLWANANRTSWNNFTINNTGQEGNKLGTDTSGYFNLTYNSSGSGANQRLTWKVVTSFGNNYVRMLYKTTCIGHDYFQELTVIR